MFHGIVLWTQYAVFWSRFSDRPAQSIKRRHVFFVNGFDPKGAAYYYSLYVQQAQKQTSVNNIALNVSPRERDSHGNSFWNISATLPCGDVCETTYHFLRWDDIVRRHWPRNIWRLLQDLIFSYALILRSGELGTVWRLSPKTLVGLVYPILIWVGGSGLVLVFGGLVANAVLEKGFAWPVSVTVGFMILVLGLWIVRELEKKLNTTLLVRIFSFAAKQAQHKLPELEARLDEMASQIDKKMHAKDVDEVLVVGFSVGSILSVSAVARALVEINTSAGVEKHPLLSLMTLGNCIPMLGLQPNADTFRKELRTLAESKYLRWFDFSSPTDWGSFALVNPIDACKVIIADRLHHDAPPNPVMRSPRFHTMFPKNEYSDLRRNKRRMHLQYLMSGELPSSYDYFAITAGDLSLTDRYADR